MCRWKKKQKINIVFLYLKCLEYLKAQNFLSIYAKYGDITIVITTLTI